MLIAFGALALRLVWMQGFHWREYQIREELRRERVRLLPAPRGRILARDGEVLAENVATHSVVYTLAGVERALGTTRAFLRLLRRSPAAATFDLDEGSLFDSLQQIREECRPLLGGDAPLPPHRWIRDLDAGLANWLKRQMERRAREFAGLSVSVSDGVGEVLVEPARLFAGEAGVRRLASRLASPPPDLYLGANGVWSEYLECRAKEEPKKRQQAFDRERVLVTGVPFSIVAEICYYPDLYPGLEVREQWIRRHPQGEELCHLVGTSGPITVEEKKRLVPKEDEAPVAAGDSVLLDILRKNLDPREFEELRDDALLSSMSRGRSGVEAEFDRSLRGTPGALFLDVDRDGEPIGEPRAVLDPAPGEELLLTVDLALCRRVREILVERQVEAGSVLVGDPTSGEILAWVSQPGYEPDRLAREVERLKAMVEVKPFLDRPRVALPPGSVIKPALALLALDAGTITAGTPYTCEGVFDPALPDYWRCRNHEGHLPLTLELEEALARSCNCYFYQLGTRWLGLDRMREGLVRLGFGIRGTLPDARNHVTNAAIGQGRLTATPQELYRFVCLLALRGEIVEPAIAVRDRGSVPVRIVPAAATEPVIDGMRKAVTAPYGTAHDVEIGLRPFDCAVKTGTPEVGRGESRRNIGWILGFAPVAAPRLAFVIAVERTQLHGGEAAGPIAAAILEWLATERGYPLHAAGQGGEG